MKQVTISSGDGQTPRHHYGFTDLLNRLNLPAPTRGTVMQVAGLLGFAFVEMLLPY